MIQHLFFNHLNSFFYFDQVIFDKVSHPKNLSSIDLIDLKTWNFVYVLMRWVFVKDIFICYFTIEELLLELSSQNSFRIFKNICFPSNYWPKRTKLNLHKSISWVLALFCPRSLFKKPSVFSQIFTFPCLVFQLKYICSTWNTFICTHHYYTIYFPLFKKLVPIQDVNFDSLHKNPDEIVMFHKKNWLAQSKDMHIESKILNILKFILNTVYIENCIKIRYENDRSSIVSKFDTVLAIFRKIIEIQKSNYHLI
jgi:hypothetical protein